MSEITSWHSYPKIYNLGHAALKDLFADSVIVEEKVDGSQFSFGKFGSELRCRSKGQQLIVDAPEKMFSEAVAAASRLFPMLQDGWTYRAEYLKTPKHNTLAYERTPAEHLIVFDVCTSEETYLPYEEKAAEAARLGLEVVPLVYKGRVENAEQVLGFMDKVSILGGTKIEGLVIKNYSKFGPDKKALLGKHVSEAFKEVNNANWKKTNPKSGDVLSMLAEEYRTTARWEKAIQHMRDAGTLEGTPKDIGALLKEVQADIKLECEAEIKEKFYRWALPHVLRSSVRGLPEWYKEKLVEKQFGEQK